MCRGRAAATGSRSGSTVRGIALHPLYPSVPEAVARTQDVDLLCEVAALSEYHRIETRLRGRGFAQDTREGAPVCRWRLGDLAIDMMPTPEAVPGFSNLWYPLASRFPEALALPSGRAVRMIRAPVFIATKLEAFHGRGGGDYLASHDLEDLVAVIDERGELHRTNATRARQSSAPTSRISSPGCSAHPPSWTRCGGIFRVTRRASDDSLA